LTAPGSGFMWTPMINAVTNPIARRRRSLAVRAVVCV